MHVIPAIDLRDGRCVRLLQGNFDNETEYSKYPAAVAQQFSQLGSRYLHVVDLDGARQGSQPNAETVRVIAAEATLRVQLGGGIRDRTRVARWLDAGVDRCVIGSAAVETPDRVRAWISEFGADRIVLALDVRVDDDGTPRVATHGWEQTSNRSLWECLDDYPTARHILCTDVSRDGALAGPNVELYAEVVRRHPDKALQASGGVRDIADLDALRGTGCAAAITGRALLDGTITQAEVQAFLRGE